MPQSRSLISSAAAWLWLILSTSGSAMAQPPREMDWAVLPSHRYLPPPQGARSVLDQIKMLEQLNQAVGEQSTEGSLELSPQQLKLLDNLLETFRNEQGDIELPNPDSIPKQWIESLLPDPKQREQAKRMLEQLAREHQIPLNDQSGVPMPADVQPKPKPADSPTSSPEPSSGNPQSTQRRPSEARPPRPGQTQPGQSEVGKSDADKHEAGTNDVGQGKSTQPMEGAEASGTSSPSALPGGIPREYRELFDKLKQFEQQKRRAMESNAPWQPQQPSQSGDSARTPRPGNRANPGRPSSGGSSSRGNSSGENKSSSRPKARQNPNAPSQGSKPGQVPGSDSDNPGVRGNDRQRGSTPGRGNTFPGGNGLDSPHESPQFSPGTNRSESNIDPSGLNSSERAGEGNSPARGSGSAPGANNSASGNRAPGSGATGTPENNGALPEIPEIENPFSKGFQAPSSEQEKGGALAPATDPMSLDRTGQSPGQGTGNSPSKPRTSRGFNVTRMSEEPKAGSNSKGMDVRKSLEQSGLAQSLKKIVQDTIKEQEAERAKAARERAAGGSSNGTTDQSIPNSINDLVRANEPPRSANDPAKPTNNTAASNSPAWPGSSANSSAAPNSSTSRNSARPQDNNWNPSNNRDSEKWARWVNDVWKSISVVPQDASRTASSGDNNSSAMNLGLPEFRWTRSMTAVVMALAVLVAVIVWLSRRRLVEIATSSQRQAEWVKAVLTDGLKSRADVIRAFHLLVGRGHGVADWWNHRFVVGYFNQRSPQYAAAMNELANVYECARYYPDDAELTPQQLEQVRSIVQSLSQSKI